jgi:membrane protein DedA with SNARE-associated domain
MTHPNLDLLRSAVVHYGYWAVGGALLLENAGIPLPGETILLLASFLAYSEHELQLSWLIMVGTVAATLGDNLGYALGHRGGRPLLDRYQSIFRIQQSTLLHGEELFARFGAATIFLARFLFGLRIIAGPLAGVLRMPWRKFVLFNFLGAVTWVSAISTVGYLFGHQWRRMQRGVEWFDLVFAILAVAAVVLLWRHSRGNRRTANH